MVRKSEDKYIDARRCGQYNGSGKAEGALWLVRAGALAGSP